MKRALLLGALCLVAGCKDETAPEPDQLRVFVTYIEYKDSLGVTQHAYFSTPHLFLTDTGVYLTGIN